MLAAAHFEYVHLVAASVGHDFRLHGGAGYERRAERYVVSIGNHQYLVDDDFGADVGRELFDFQLCTRGNAILLAAGLDDRIHDLTLYTCWTTGYGKPSIIPKGDF